MNDRICFVARSFVIWKRLGFQRAVSITFCVLTFTLTTSGGTRCWWNGKWEPTFKNARHLVAGGEYEYWSWHREKQQFGDYMGDSVDPLLAAGLLDRIETDHKLCDEVWLEPTPGHTPGHVSVRIASKGQQALLTGDFIHSPSQMARHHWGTTADSDQKSSGVDSAANPGPVGDRVDACNRNPLSRSDRRSRNTGW
jgi:hypothetical protein